MFAKSGQLYERFCWLPNEWNGYITYQIYIYSTSSWFTPPDHEKTCKNSCLPPLFRWCYPLWGSDVDVSSSRCVDCGRPGGAPRWVEAVLSNCEKDNYPPKKTNMTMENQPWMKMYILFKIGIVHPSFRGFFPPKKLRWNLRIADLKGRNICKPRILRFDVDFRGSMNRNRMLFSTG